ncbi:MAG: tRNA (5-methylaminomethyl-2-thiouridine)(34)-methyltransferase MnmD [Pseudomonadota bacterium]
MSDLDQPTPDDHTAAVVFRDGVPVSRHFDDPYYALNNGAAESAHVFIAGNDLPHRFYDGFQIAELGFGTGLNLLVTLMAWDQSGLEGRFDYTSFEAFPMTAADMTNALSHVAIPKILSQALIGAVAQGQTEFSLGPADVTIVLGDARATLPEWTGCADAWYLDGFAPARNPELWQEDLLREVAAHTTPGGSFATYTAAGVVRRALSEAGFDVKRQTGFGRKRHMTTGTLR